jgi:hypothetical protein
MQARARDKALMDMSIEAAKLLMSEDPGVGVRQVVCAFNNVCNAASPLLSASTTDIQRARQRLSAIAVRASSIRELQMANSVLTANDHLTKDWLARLVQV